MTRSSLWGRHPSRDPPSSKVQILGQRYEHGPTRRFHLAADMPLSSRVVGQQDVARAEPADSAVPALEFDGAAQGDDKLPARGGMKVEGAARKRPAEDDPGRRYPIREPAMHGLVLGDDQSSKCEHWSSPV